MPTIEKPPDISEMEAPGQPYSTVVRVGDHFHFSGIVATKKDEPPNGSVEGEITEVFIRMRALLETCGLTVKDVYSVNVFLVGNMEAYDFLNKQWNSCFGSCEIKPRRSVVAVSALPLDALVEIVFDAVKQSE